MLNYTYVEADKRKHDTFILHALVYKSQGHFSISLKNERNREKNILQDRAMTIKDIVTNRNC